MWWGDIPGWFTQADFNAIREIAVAHKPKRVLEIGVFAGRSTIAWANILPDAEIWGCDPLTWRAGDALSTNPHLDPRIGPDTLANGYGEAIKNTRDHKNIRLLRCKSDELRGIFAGQPKFDCIFIDGDHSPEGIAHDLYLALDLIGPGGVICGHDFLNPLTPAVEPAVRIWAWENGRNVEHHDGSFVFSAC